MTSGPEFRSRAVLPGEYFDDPFGQYFLGNSFLAAAFRPDIFCLVAWGKIGHSDFLELADLLSCPELKNHSARKQLVCHEGLEGVSTSAVMGFFNFMKKHPEYFAGMSREALSRGPGLVGMISEGFYRTTPLPFPARAFSSRLQALEWLSPQLASGPILQELNTLCEKLATVADPLLGHMRSTIIELGYDCDLSDVARSLGVSRRTLQRRMQKAGTGYEQEMTLLRIRSAKEQLFETEASIKSIAAALAYSSPGAFIAAFKRSEGITPTQWRLGNLTTE